MKTLNFFIVLSVILAVSCHPEEEKITTSSDVQLLFSADTVLFDTLLTEKLSLTKRFRIFNPSKNAVSISSIRLGFGKDSDYRIFVNGKEGPEINDEVLFGGDSLLVLVDAEIDPHDENLPYIVKDSVVVDWNNNSAHVKLVSWGQDAVYLNGKTIRNETWTADRPYVIYNFAMVDTLCVLTVEPGAQIFLDNQAALYVKGSLRILGDSGNHVTVRNTRFDEHYLEAPGQWDGIYFLEGSKDNEVHYAEIENGNIGLRVGSPDEDADPDVTVTHTAIRHMATAGILAFTSDVYAYNTLIFNCGAFTVGNFAGGNYTYTHCTFTNYPNFFVTEDPSVQFSDHVVLGDDDILAADLTVRASNCIIWGANDEELLISNGGGAQVDLTFDANIIRTKEEVPANYGSTKDNYPGFSDPMVFDYRLDSLAFAIDKGVAAGITDDITGRLRDDVPDIGAYERLDRE